MAAPPLAVPPPPCRVFVSYRRADEPYAVDSIVQGLEARFGAAAVFRDQDDIRRGDDWRQAIDGALSSARVCVVVIGPHWAADRHGVLRLDRPDDMVAYEVARALEGDVPLIPVCVAGARLPAPEDVPAAIRGLADRQGIEVRSGRDLARDLADLVEAVEAQGVPPAEPSDPVRAALLRRLDAVTGRLWRDTLRDEWQVAPPLIETPDLIEPGGWFGTGRPVADVMEAFDRAGGVLLIHGPPGSGKTTEALSLVRGLLHRARRDPAAPLPLRLDLASWVTHGGEIEDWIATEHVRLPVGGDTLRQMVDAEQFVPVLDGLDEVAAGRRQACLDAIGRYLARRRLKQVVVCSRTAEYRELSGKLPSGLAVEVGRLSLDEIRRYLAGHEAWGPVVAELTTRPRERADGAVDALWQLLERPLGLSIAVQAYHAGGDPAELIEDPRAGALWARYSAVAVERGLERGAPPGYGATAVLRWLGYLASNRRAAGAVEIWLHELPLPGREAERATWRMSISFGLVAGVAIGLVVALGRREAWPAIGAAVAVGAAVAIGMGLSRWFVPERRFGLRVPLTVRSVLYGAYLSASVGGVGVGVPTAFVGGDALRGLAAGAVAFSGLGLTLLAAVLLLDFTRFDARDPFALMRASRRLALGAGGAAGAVAGVWLGWVVADHGGSAAAGVAAGLLAAAGLGAVAGALLGGTMLTEYLGTVRYQARRGLGPLRYGRFLEWAAANALLHRSGATYRFVHVELRDHLADRFEAAREIVPHAAGAPPVSSAP